MRAGLVSYLCCPNILTVYHEKRTKMISEPEKSVAEKTIPIAVPPLYKIL